MSEQQLVLGELCAQPQELGTWATQTGATATHGVTGMSAIE